MYKFFSLFLLCFWSALSAQTNTVTWEISVPIQEGTDDVEEQPDGWIYGNSTDIELTEDTGAEQLIGLHFKGVNIPDDATVEGAYLQFTCDEVSTGACNLSIQTEATGNASAFDFDTSFHLADKNLSATQISWSPEDWLLEEASGPLQRSPDLTTLIEELRSLPDWQVGNAINIIISGTGQRTAEAFEGNAAAAARLVITLSTEVSTGNLSDVFINELMPANEVFTDEVGERDDWFELYNANDFAVSLEGIFLSDDALDLQKWQITSPLFIPAQGFQLFWADDSPEQGANHLPFKLNSSGEILYFSQIQNEELVVIDSVSYPETPENVSYGRSEDGAEDWVLFAEYSPEASNNGSLQFLNAEVTLSPPGGYYPNSLPVNMTCSDPAAEIRYTTDGSVPTATSTLYTNAVFINEPTNLRATAFKPGFASNSSDNEFYLVNAEHDLPVVQVSINPEHLWDAEEGIYITGSNGSGGYCSEEPRNWNQDWERPVSVGYYTPEGEEAFRLDADIKIGGGCSRGFSMKGLNFFFRDGVKVEYPLFGQTDIDEFKRFKLRASGNDFSSTFLRDATIQALLYNQLDIDQMAYEPVVVYLNNEYWGVYGLREFYNRHYIASHHNVDEDNLDYMKQPYYWPDLKEGDTEAWDELMDYVSSNNLGNAQQYTWVDERIDINEYINYHATQIYVANYDWPANNVGIWRSRDGGKFRWLLYDLDLSSAFGFFTPSFADYDAISHATNTIGDSWPNGSQSTLLLRRLLVNQSFRNEFVQRYCTIAQTIFQPERTEHYIDSLKQRIQPEMNSVMNKFNNAPASWQMWFSNPAGGNFTEWNNNINDFKNFFSNRLSFTLENFENKFGYTGHYTLSINTNEDTPGKVLFHDNEMEIPLQHSAEYFNNIPIRIKAVADPGYIFVRWSETGVTNPELNFVASSARTLTPIFAPDGTVSTEEAARVLPAVEIFPTIADEVLYLKSENNLTSNTKLRFLTAAGQVLDSYETELLPGILHSLSISHLQEGIYFVEVKQGAVCSVLKIVVQR